MAKKSMIAREVKRRKLVEVYSDRQSEVKSRVINPELGMEEQFQAMLDLQKFPRDSNPSRGRNRCGLTGRSRGYYRKFGLSRNKLREVIMRGEAPGVVKSSW